MHSPKVPLPQNAWLTVGLLWFVGCLNYLDRLMLITMRISVKEDIPMTDAQFGLLTTIFLVVYAILSPLGGYLADRVSCSKTIVGSLFVWSGVTWLTAHATTFEHLLISRAVMGLSEACYLPAAVALIARYHGNETRSLANGLHLSGVMVGSGLGGLGGIIAENYRWTFAFELFGIIGVLYAGILLFVLKDGPIASTSTPATNDAKPRFGETLAALFRDKKYLIALVFWGILGITSWAFTGWLPTFLTEKFSLPQGKAGMMATGFMSLGTITGMILGGILGDIWGRKKPDGRAYVGIIGLAICIPCVLIVANAWVLPVAMTALVVFGITRSFPDTNMMPILFGIVDQRHRATAYGMLNAFATMSGGVTIYVGGALRDAHVNITTVFYTGAAGMVICAALLWLIRPRAPAV